MPIGGESRIRARFKALIVLALLGGAIAAPPAAAVAVIDDAGSALNLAQPAERIVSLAPHATELLYAVGAGDKLVGAVAYSDYPAAARRIPRIGSAQSIDLEAVLALQPDVIIAWQSGNGMATIERLRALGLSVFVSEPRRLDDIPLTLERLGRLAGTMPIAEAAAQAFRARKARLAERYSRQGPVRVFYQIWNRPLMTINGEQLISQVLRLCGGRNIFAGLPALAAAVDIEAVLAADPEAIVASGADARRPAWLDAWKHWPGLTAVARGNLFSIHPDLIQRHSPRILDGAQQLCAALEQARAKRPPP